MMQRLNVPVAAAGLFAAFLQGQPTLAVTTQREAGDVANHEDASAGKRLMRRATSENAGTVDEEGNHYVALKDGTVSIVSAGDWSGNFQSSDSSMAESSDAKEPVPEMMCSANTAGNSEPGTPAVDKYKLDLTAFDAKIAALGDRLVKVAEADEAARKCGSFYSFGDYTWCRKVMPAEVAAYVKANPNGGQWCNASGTTSARIRDSLLQSDLVKAEDMVGLSYGIEDVDPWSELMSSQYHVPAKLHDCYVRSGQGPMFEDLHADHTPENPCSTTKCYTIPYDYHRICLSNVSEIVDGYKFESLGDHLHGRKDHSVFIKMDVEGSEWPTLDALTKDEDMIKKIRTLDLEIHLTFAGGIGYDFQRRVEVLERLKDRFAVTGSNIRAMFSVAQQDFDNRRKTDPSFKNTFDIYTSNGMPLVQYVMSFVNRDLL